jgi:hypothetical protein
MKNLAWSHDVSKLSINPKMFLNLPIEAATANSRNPKLNFKTLFLAMI